MMEKTRHVKIAVTWTSDGKRKRGREDDPKEHGGEP